MWVNTEIWCHTHRHCHSQLSASPPKTPSPTPGKYNFLPPFICLRFCFISQELFYKLICQATQTSIEPCETKLRKTVARKLYFLCTEKYYRNSNRLGFEVTVSRPTGANLIHNEIQTFQFQNQSRLILETVKCSSSCLCGCDYACSL